VKNGKPEKLTSTWITITQPSVQNAKPFYRKKVAPPERASIDVGERFGLFIIAFRS
jgi:hypothetical protein